MRDTTKALTEHYLAQLDLSGKVLQVGGRHLGQSAIDLFPAPRFTLHNMNGEASKIPDTIVADITDCRDTIPDESFDLVISFDVFEHLTRPWLAAAEIDRILKPGGLAITQTRFDWPNKPGRSDYWRYSPESLDFLFSSLECLEKGYDTSGEWREEWSVYHVGRKGSGQSVTRFRDSDHPLAVHLREHPAEMVTEPQFPWTTTPPSSDAVQVLRPALAEITDRLVDLEKLLADRIGQLDAIDSRSRRLERRIDRAVASFPLRTVLRVRRGLHRMLK
jgi:SAM-dependent methyltransferase